ncbi:MAG TPA: adenylate/guanylate cyclase domain-containing protein, partial [Chthoniobacterales bacterium]
MPLRPLQSHSGMLSADKADVFRKRIIIGSVIALIVFSAVVALDLSEPFVYMRGRNFLRDAIARCGRKTPANPDLVFLAIDSESVTSADPDEVEQIYGPLVPGSIESRGLHAMKKQWPWSREVYGLVLERVLDAGAKVVLFDLTFPTPMTGDEPFRRALEKYHDRVVLGSNFVYSEKADGNSSVITDSQPSESLIPPISPRDDRIGYTNYWPDDDDVVRHAQYRVTKEEINRMEPADGSERFLSLGARALSKAGLGTCIPDGTDSRLFRYTAPARQGFPPRSLVDVFDPIAWEHTYKSGEFFRGKIVLVGAEGNWQHDEHPTPFGSMPGPELHLNAINAAIHHEFVAELPHVVVQLTTLLAAITAVALWFSVRSPWLRLLVLLAANVGDVLTTLFAYNAHAVYIPCLPFLLELNATVLIGFVCDFTWERVEKTHVRRTLEKYVSTNVVREMLDRPRAFQESLGGIVRPATILFSDIRGYTSVSAKTNPQALVSQLNEYLSAMVECVFRYGGTLDKFIGDAVMAVWGNVHSDGVAVDAANAVRAGLAMREELARLNADWRKRGLTELRIGVAINQGDVVVGNVGSPRRMEFTVIGDPVNVTWKLQELTKQVQSELVVSKSVASLV